MADEWQGRTIDGRYVVEATLGAGGMGVVLRARHQFTGAHVALKMLRSHLQLDPGVQARFLAEARAPTAIGHRGIVQVLDAGRTPDGELYLAMELLEGVSLRDAVRAGLPGAEIKRIVLELLDALAAAHARGVVHRDLKPENVFLAGPQRSVKLLDFGIAKIVASDPSAMNHTAAGALLGTLAYMAPEQLRDASTVDPRADLWAVGVMVYEMIARRLPYRATDLHALFVQIATQDPDPIQTAVPGVAPSIAAFFVRALARDPGRRYASAAELAAAVHALPIDQRPVAAPVAMVDAGQATAASAVAVGSNAGGWTGGTAFAATSASGPGLPGAFGSQSGAPSSVPHAAVPYSAVPYSAVPNPAVPNPAVPNSAVPNPAVPYSAVPNSAVPNPAVPNPSSSRRRRAAWPFVLLGVAAIAGIVIVVVATRGGAASIAVPPTDPTPAPAPGPGPDPWKGSADDPWKSPTPPVPTNPTATPSISIAEQQCTERCRATARCGLPAVPTCEQQCLVTPLFATCMTTASPLDACAHAAACLFLAPCKVVPHGVASCAAAAVCQGNCGTSMPCACACMEQMAPIHAAALARLDACGLACGTNQQCIAQNCTPLVAACARE